MSSVKSLQMNTTLKVWVSPTLQLLLFSYIFSILCTSFHLTATYANSQFLLNYGLNLCVARVNLNWTD